MPVQRAGHGTIIPYRGDLKTSIILLIVQALKWECPTTDDVAQQDTARPTTSTSRLTEEDKELDRILSMLQEVCYNEEAGRTKSMKPEYCRPLLGVPEDASLEHITKRFRRLSLLLHPDKCSDERGEEAFIAVKDAFEQIKLLATAPQEEPRWSGVFDEADNKWQQQQNAFFSRRSRGDHQGQEGEEKQRQDDKKQEDARPHATPSPCDAPWYNGNGEGVWQSQGNGQQGDHEYRKGNFDDVIAQFQSEQPGTTWQNTSADGQQAAEGNFDNFTAHFEETRTTWGSFADDTRWGYNTSSGLNEQYTHFTF